MLSVVIPCYNEEAVLPHVYERICSAAAEWDDDWEVLLVNDGSRDRTWELIEDFHERDPRWKGICLARNFGHQAAVGAGLEQARGDVVAVLDADLQDPPELVSRMIARWRQGYDVVYGIRTRRPESWFKRFCYATFYRVLARASDVPLPEDAGDFCLMDRRVVQALLSFPEQHPFWRGLRCWTGYRHVGLPYARQERQAGKTQYTLRKLFKLAADGVLCLSQTPLRAIGWLGGIATATVLGIAIPLGVWGSSTTTATALLWAGLFVGSLQLLCLGVLGQYLGRIYDEVRRRPRWIIAEIIGIESSEQMVRSHRRHRLVRTQP
jgi:dolichol-phosphate mannosyltransferase